MQLGNVISGFLMGLPALVAVGPIAVLLMELGLERGMRAGYPAAVGVAVGDLVFAVLAAVAGTAVAAALSSVEPALRAVAALVLIGVAVRMALAARSGSEDHPPATGELVAVGGSGAVVVGGVRLAGGFMGLTMVNPLTIVVYAGIVMSGGAGVGTAGWVLGMGLASLVVHGGFVGLGHALGSTVSDGAVTGLRWAASGLLAVLALHLLLA